MNADLSESRPPFRTARDATRLVARRRRGEAASLLLLALLVLAPLAGCGYTQNEVFPDQYRTVAVPMFENRTHYRHVEMQLSEALVKEIERRTPYKVVSPAVADTVLQGVIVSIDQSELARRPRGGVPEELELTVTVDFEWRDREGEVVRSRHGFEAVGHYVPARPISEPFETARHTVVQQLAAAIVSTLRSDW